MALNNSQYDTIIRAYEQKQLHNRNVLDKRYKTVYNRLPELKEIGAGLRMRRLQRYRIHRQSKMSLFPQSSHRSALYTIQFTAYFGKRKF